MQQEPKPRGPHSHPVYDMRAVEGWAPFDTSYPLSGRSIGGQGQHLMPDHLAALQQAVAAIRAQIPKGELTLGSVERLLQAAEAVCAEANSPGVGAAKIARPTKQQEARKRWAQIARQNEKVYRSSTISA